MPTTDLSGVRELGTPGVRQATEAALGGVQAATLLSSAVAGAQDVAARVKGSHESVAAAGVPAAQLRLCRLHLRRRRLRLLHPSRHRHRHRCLHLHRRHRSPHLCHHPHPHPLLLLHRHYRRPHYLLQLPCPAWPC
ncbi:unnamed protein product [Closterium sp. NIES-54]